MATTTYVDLRRRPPEEGARNGARDHIHPQLRLKCIVLGSAGAGKTSLLRRFAHGTFEGPSGRDGHHHWRSRTRGADYYVKMVANPLFDGGAAAAASSPSALASGSPHVLVQLWDTVGKESLKPRRRHDAKSNFYQVLSVRPSVSSSSSSSPSSPTNDNNGSSSSNYEHRYNNWGFLNGIARERGGGGANGRGGDPGPVRNIGDGGNERAHPGCDAPQHRGPDELSRRNNINEATGGALFRNIDACMLVYDAT